MNPTVDGVEQIAPKRVYYTGSDILLEGYALCFDHDYSSGATAADNLKARITFAEKPGWANLAFPAGVVAPGQGCIQGPCWVSVVPPWDSLRRGVRVWTDENVAVGDPLGLVPGSYAMGRPVVGEPLFVSAEAADKSGTAGAVYGWVGRVVDLMKSQWSQRIHRYFDDFYGQYDIAAVDVGTYVLTGTSAAAAYVDSTTPADQATAALRAMGVLALTTNTTNQANLSMNGEPWHIATGASVLVRARFSISSVAATTNLMIGLGLAGGTSLAGAPGVDFIGFSAPDGALALVSQKGATGILNLKASVGTLVADTYYDAAFIIRNRSATAGRRNAITMLDGTVTTTALTTAMEAELPDNQSLTFLAEAVGGSARVLRLDQLEIVHAGA